jgi:hypothetical protein
MIDVDVASGAVENLAADDSIVADVARVAIVACIRDSLGATDGAQVPILNRISIQLAL